MTQRNCLSGCCVWLATSRPNRSPRASAGQRSTLARGMSTARLLDLMSRPTGCSRGRSHLERGGTYTLLVNPAFGVATTLSMTLNPAPDLVADGAAATITSAAPSYGTWLTFAGTAGQNLALELTGLSFTGAANGYVTLNVNKPDGTQWPQGLN